MDKHEFPTLALGLVLYASWAGLVWFGNAGSGVGFDPAHVMFSANRHPPDWRRKDSLELAERRGEFVYNMATFALRREVTRSSQIYDSRISELAAVGLSAAASRIVKTPRVAESPVAFECVHHTTTCLPGNSVGTTHYMVVGKVVGVHIADEVIGSDGKLDVASMKPLARLGYADYTYVDRVFPIELEDDFAGQEEAARFNRLGLFGGS